MPHRFLASVLPQHETAELYRLMVVGIRDCAVFLMDANGIITVWNKAAEEMKGFSADEAIGSHLRILYTDPDRAARLPERNLETAEKAGFFSGESWRRRKDGSLFWAHVILTALRGNDNELLGFSKVTMDLTHHKLLEACQKETAEMDFILRTAGCGTWKWDPGTGEVRVAKHLQQLLGHPEEEKTYGFDGWLALIHPDERGLFKELVQQQVATTTPVSTAVELQMRLQCRSGDYRWFFLRANWHAFGEQALPANPVFLGACVAIDNLKHTEAQRERLYGKLRQERARFANILDQMPSGVVLAEVPQGRLIYQNRAAEDMLGRGIADVASCADYYHYRFTDERGRQINTDHLPLVRTLRYTLPPISEELVYQHPQGGRRHFAATTASIRDNDGVARIAVAAIHDISRLKEAEQRLATEKERAQVTLAALTDGVVTTDRHGAITSINPAAERVTGLRADRALGQNLCAALRFDEPGSAQRLADAIERCLQERRVITDVPYATIINAHQQRFAIEHAVAPIALGDGEIIGAVLVFHDVTESKRLMRRLGFEASHDALTGLVNRREFESRLHRALERAQHPGGDASALLYMDLDQFKVVNDTCGHSAGDDLLKQLAKSYSDHVRERDTLARIGGDEFAMIVEHCEVEEALGVANKILEATRSFRYTCKGRIFQPGVSIGLAPVDRGTASIEEAMRRADHACYIAKERGRNRIYVHYKGDLDFAQRRSDMHWVTRLSHAFQHDQLMLYCQPIIALHDGEQRTHYEILLRLKDGHAAPVGPASFLPAAERYDVILKIDRWVLGRTLDWMSANRAHLDALEMCSVNLSRRSLADQSFHQFAVDLIAQSPFPAGKLCFEITEHGAIADIHKTIAFIEALSARGCRFSLDDFGTGMTSFSYLKQLPVDFIKIDGSLIQAMSSSAVDFEMVRFTNDISHMMGRKTIAEYVSDSTILASLRDIGVDYAQGYWVGKPRPLAMMPGQ